jgi:hypothetical protein
VNLETYLISKKIDSSAFQQAEPDLWKAWSYEFEQMHPNSFTLQKLNLINPIRRKYPLKIVPVTVQETPSPATSSSPPTSTSEVKPSNPAPLNPKPAIPKPVFKPKPKMT